MRQEKPPLISVTDDSFAEIREYSFALPAELTGRSDIYLLVEQSLHDDKVGNAVYMPVWIQPGVLADGRLRLGFITIPREDFARKGTRGIADALNNDERIREKLERLIPKIRELVERDEQKRRQRMDNP